MSPHVEAIHACAEPTVIGTIETHHMRQIRLILYPSRLVVCNNPER